ncbi:MAG: hypothetical protein OXN89_22700 [Bryobacterales bacterium]|nr:hypothetical protein [Bryobacterales bacterium]
MSGELIAILGVGASLAALLLGLFAWLRADLARLEGRITRLDGRVAEHGDRLARIEVLLEGLGLRGLKNSALRT